MGKLHKPIQILMVLALMVGLLTPAALSAESTSTRIQPLLVEMAVEQPDKMVRVIVQKSDDTDQAERLVEKLGGKYLKELRLINAFAAEFPAKAVPALASAVSWVALDAPVVSTGKPTNNTASYYLLDTFPTAVFNNNDALASFTTDWIEDDVAGVGPITGNIWVWTDQLTKCDGTTCYPVSGDGELRLSDRPDTGTQPSAAREMDLSNGVTSATLSFTYNTGPGVESNEDTVVLEISADGGSTYAGLWTFDYLYGNKSGAMSFNIIEYASYQTRIRFRVSNAYDGPDEYFAVDDVRIEYEGSTLPNNTYLDTLDVQDVWDMGYTGSGIGVAVIDSGISSDSDLNLVYKTSFNPNSNTVNDVFGHGTHVAGIIGGNGSDSDGYYMGIAPDVNLISLKISDENGLAYESDTVDAMQWVFENKDQYNIRVVNLSIQSTVEQSYHDSALTAAAEILWFNGVVVVAATGNWYGGAVYPLNAAPGNDPFIITVGATNEKNTTKLRDDVIPSFSVMGYTQDGFFKPEIFAPGKDIISVLSRNSSWDLEHPERTVFGRQYFRISGTSMATPMVSGAVALLLQAEPNLTPDQVKYRLMNAHEWVAAYPYLSIEKLLTTSTTESANQDIIPHQLLAKMAMIAYWASVEGEENIDWENVDWAAVNWNAVNWNAVNWNAVNWNAVNWNAVNWNAVNWNAVNWNAVNWDE